MVISQKYYFFKYSTFVLKFRLLTILTAFLLFFCTPILAMDTKNIDGSLFDQEEAMFWGEEEKIIAATKYVRPLKDAPAIATVISYTEIKNMGARNLMDVLKIVPGLGIYIARYGQNEIAVRGIKTDSTGKVKILIDGHSINEPFMGSAMTLFDDIGVDNIKRIEIIRGPGSALYGSNAFLSVINIITFDAEDIDGVKITAGGGSYSTKRHNILFGKKKGDFSISGSAGNFDTDGARLDLGSGQNRTLLWKKKNDFNLKLSYKDFTFNSKYTKRNRSDYIGILGLTNDESDMELYQYFLETGYKHDISNKIKMVYKLFYDEFSEKIIFEAIPNSFFLGINMSNRIFGSEINGTGELFRNNYLTIGAAYEDIKQYNVSMYAGDSQGSLTLDPNNWSKDNAKRNIMALYIQDEWTLPKNISLTAGLRYDNYSDFGESLNPRTGIVWHTTDKVNIKLLYGKAFKAPNFRDIYDRNNPNTEGNEDLNPETIKTIETGIEYTPTKFFRVRANYFLNMIRDIILAGTKPSESKPAPFINKGRVDVQGVELDLKVGLKNTYSYLNYTFQSSNDNEFGGISDDNLVDVPAHKGNIGGNMEIFKYYNINANLFIKDSSPRSINDNRKDDLPAYALLNMTLIVKNFFDTTEVSCSVQNIFNEEYEDPSPPNYSSNDFPRPGRNFMVNLSYEY